MLQAMMSFLVIAAFLLAIATIVGTLAAQGRRILYVLTGADIAPRRQPVRAVRTIPRRAVA
jgi:hypothetical protein